MYRRGLRGADLEDAVQEVFLRIVAHWDEFEARSTRQTWAIGFARFVALECLRSAERVRRHVEFCELDTALCPPAAESDDGWQRVCLRERLRQCVEVLEALPARQRSFCELAYYWGLTAKEIAAQTDSSLRTVNRQLEKARASTRRVSQGEPDRG